MILSLVFIQNSHTQVDRLEDEKCNLLTSCESLKKELEEIKREREKVKISVEHRVVLTDIPALESAAISTEVSNSGRRDSHFGTQQHETQDRPESGQGNSNTQTHR